MKKVIFLIAVFVGIGLVLFVGYLLSRDTLTKDQAVPGNEIIYYDHGFSPQAMRAAAGSRITIENESSRDLQLSSDPHPDHTRNPELNLNVIPPGDSLELVVVSRGTWGYHDHLHPQYDGLLVVE